MCCYCGILSWEYLCVPIYFASEFVCIVYNGVCELFVEALWFLFVCNGSFLSEGDSLVISWGCFFCLRVLLLLSKVCVLFVVPLIILVFFPQFLFVFCSSLSISLLMFVMCGSVGFCVLVVFLGVRRSLMYCGSLLCSLSLEMCLFAFSIVCSLCMLSGCYEVQGLFYFIYELWPICFLVVCVAPSTSS